MIRQKLVTLIVAFMLGVCCSAWTVMAAGRAWPAKPNIVLILVDDMGYGDPVCYNSQSKCLTPNIDEIAAQGIRFTDAHTPGSVCTPTRYGLLTGRFPFRGDLRDRKVACIPDGRMTIASLLKEHHYHTAMVGKWHLGFVRGDNYDYSKPLEGGPVDRGFDDYFGIPSSLDTPPYFYIDGNQAIAPASDTIAASSSDGWSPVQGAFWRAGQVAVGFRHEEVLPRFGEKAIQTIEQHAEHDSGDPLFLYLALPAPHTPWLPLAKYRGKTAVAMYGDFVLQVDSVVGQVLDALERTGMSEDTLVIVTSDNGPVWYPHDVKKYDHASAGHLRGMKGDAWEGGHRVPFLARWPGRIPAGATCSQMISLTDMMATFAAILGDTLPANAGEDSVNILPALLGKSEGPPLRTGMLLKKDGSVVRQGPWKLIPYLGSGGFTKPRRIDPSPGDPPGQLYNLDEDPSEQHNLWLDKPEFVHRLTELRRQYVERGRSTPLPGTPGPPP